MSGCRIKQAIGFGGMRKFLKHCASVVLASLIESETE